MSKNPKDAKTAEPPAAANKVFAFSHGLVLF